MSARPLVKWAGGKTKLIPDLLRHIGASGYRPEKARYVEPFVGGAALFFALESREMFDMARLSDVNGELVNFYFHVQNHHEELIKTLLCPERRFVYEKGAFADWRAKLPSSLSPVVRAARFLYLNRTCFNGLYRVNRAGQFNVPFGRYQNPTIVDEANIRAAAKAFEHVSIQCLHFSDAVRDLDPGDLVYFDPPYDPVSETANFTSYSEGGFAWKDQVALCETASALARAGVIVIASNASTFRVRQLWKDAGFVLHEVKAARAISCDAAKRAKVSELIMVSP